MDTLIIHKNFKKNYEDMCKLSKKADEFEFGVELDRKFEDLKEE